MTMRRWILVAAAGVTLAGLAWSGPRVWESKVTLARYRPELPELSTWPAVAQEQFRERDRAARTVFKARGAMADLARLYQANGFFEEALACYEGLREVEPRNAQWHHLPAAVLSGLGRVEEAEPLFRRAAKLAPDYLPAHVRTGDVLLKANRWGDAQRQYEDVLARFGEEPYALLGLARVAIARERWEEAEQLLNRAVAKDRNFAAGYFLLVTVHRHFGREEEAAKIEARVNHREFGEMRDPWVDELIDVCYEPYFLSVAASAAIFRHDPELAIRCLERAASLAEKPGPYLRQLGQVHLITRDPAGAANYVARAVAMEPTDAEAWTIWVNALLTMGWRTEAYRVVRDGLRHCPESGALRFVHGHMLSADGRMEQAIEELRVAKRFRSTQADVYIELGRAYFKIGDDDAGAAEMKEALSVQPDHPVALVIVARYTIDRGNAEEAREWIRRVRLQPRIVPEDVELVVKEYREKFGRSP